jgi:hypothetical protein
MNHDMYRFKLGLINRLNQKAKEERENYTMEAAESDYGLLFWVVLFLLAMYVMWVPR